MVTKLVATGACVALFAAAAAAAESGRSCATGGITPPVVIRLSMPANVGSGNASLSTTLGGKGTRWYFGAVWTDGHGHGRLEVLLAREPDVEHE